MPVSLGDIISQIGTGTYRLVKGKDVDITEASDIGEDLEDNDIILVDNGAAGTQASTTKSAVSRIWSYVNAKLQAVTNVSSYAWVLDQDDLGGVSSTATKVPTQQSVKAYVDNEISNVGSGGTVDISVAGSGVKPITMSDTATGNQDLHTNTNLTFTTNTGTLNTGRLNATGTITGVGDVNVLGYTGVGGRVKLRESTNAGTNSISISAPNIVTTDTTLKLPDGGGNSGQVLSTSGGTGSNVTLSWVDLPSSGGSSVAVIGNASGRWGWSSTDDFERVMTGSTSFGPFGYYSFTTEPSSTTIRTYTGSEIVGTTNANMSAYYAHAFGIRNPYSGRNNDFRVTAGVRFTGAANGARFGMSVWGAPAYSNGASQHTFTLRGVSSDVSTVSTSSLVPYTITCNVQRASDEWFLVMLESRSSLSSTTYAYGQWQFTKQ